MLTKHKTSKNVTALKTSFLFFLFITSLIVTSILAVNISKRPNHFWRQTEEKIKFQDYEECRREWLSFQPKLKRYDINVFHKDDILKILKITGNDGGFFSSYFDLNTPGYNPYDTKFLGPWYLKNPPNNLITIYFKPRNNPFNEKYPIGDFRHTLDDLLKHEITIEAAYIFWDASKTQIDPNVKIHYQTFQIDDDQNIKHKKELIQNYLYNNKITNDKRYVETNCYNIISDTGIVAPYQPGYYNNRKIEAIYFDDGSRVTETEMKIDDLLKLSNGAKNIYLFDFCSEEVIELPDSLDPFETISNWQTEINRNLPIPLIECDRFLKPGKGAANIEIEINGSTKNINFSYKHILWCRKFKNNNKIYSVTCKDRDLKNKIAKQFQSDYGRWLSSCPIKYNSYYSGREIRNKLGRYSRTLYDEYGTTHNYRYIENTFIDDWYIDGSECTKTYYNFLNPNLPPVKPKILQNDNYSLWETKTGRFTAKELKEAGFGAKQLKDKDYTVEELKNYKYIVLEINDNKFIIKESELVNLKGNYAVKYHLEKEGQPDVVYEQLFTKNDLKDAGYTLQELKQAGFNI